MLKNSDSVTLFKSLFRFIGGHQDTSYSLTRVGFIANFGKVFFNENVKKIPLVYFLNFCLNVYCVYE